MSSLALAALVLAGEFALGGWLILFVLLRRQRKTVAAQAATRAADEAAAEALHEQVQAGEDGRRQALATIFESTYQMQGEELERTVEEFIARETAFYQAMTSVYLQRDRSGLQALPAELTRLLAPWLRMTPRNMVPAGQVEAMAESKAGVEAELAETRRTIEELMREYVAAFDKTRAAETPAAQAGAAAAALEPIEALEELEALETPAAGSGTAAPPEQDAAAAGQGPEPRAAPDTPPAAPDAALPGAAAAMAAGAAAIEELLEQIEPAASASTSTSPGAAGAPPSAEGVDALREAAGEAPAERAAPAGTEAGVNAAQATAVDIDLGGEAPGAPEHQACG